MKIVLRPQVLLGMLILAAVTIIALFLDITVGKELGLVAVGGIIATMHKLVVPSG